MKIVIPIGISGSGKSTLYNKVFKDEGFVKICPDDIRKELTGDISNQSKNKEVFEMVDVLIDDCVKNNVNCYLDATNLNTKLRKKLIKRLDNTNNPNLDEIEYWVLPVDIYLSYQRIQKDLKENIDRSRVPYEVLERQLNMYYDSLKSIENEGVDCVLYYTQEDLDKILCTQ